MSLSSQSHGYGTDKTTYNTQDKHEKLQKLNLTKTSNPGLVAFYEMQPGNGQGLF